MKKTPKANGGKDLGKDPTPRKLKRRKRVDPDPEPAPKPKKKRGVYLRRAIDCRKLLSRIINEVLDETRSEKVLRAVAYGVSILLRSLEIGEFEARLSVVEQKLEQREKHGGNGKWQEVSEPDSPRPSLN